jgi:hypothetical protein
VIIRRLGLTIGAAVLAALMVLGTAGAAWATFSQHATGSLSVATLALQPPTGLVTSCNKSNHVPTVAFTKSTSIGVVADHPTRSPAQVMGYVTSLTLNGTLDPNGYSQLSAQATAWTGPSQKATSTVALSIVTIYGYWISDVATVTFQC